MVMPQSGFEVSVFLKKKCYGLKVVAGDFLASGELEVINRWSNNGYYDKWADNFVLTPENRSYSAVYYNTNHYESWYTEDNPYWDRYLRFIWHLPDGTNIALHEQAVSVSRNKYTVVNVELNHLPTVGANLVMLYDDYEMVEGDSYTFGKDVNEYEW